MEFLLWLLLPVAAASGWLTARRSLSSQAESNSRKLSSHYLKGLNYLLNEQPDKAIDVFIKLIDVDNETVETHLALGILFRRRGEVNRAIRIHQNLMMRPGINAQQRGLAALELGQDYRHAGLLDRAENLFQELIQDGHYQVYAYRHLLDIYQQEHDWDKAIKIAEQLSGISDENYNPVVAQYYCEQAEQYKLQGNIETSFAKLQDALAADPSCVRASLTEGRLALEARDTGTAIRAFQRVEKQDAGYISEIIAPLQDCYKSGGCVADFASYLHYLVKRYGGISSMLALAEIIKEQEGEEQALEFVINQLKERPTVRGLAHFVDIKLNEAEGAARENLLLLKEITSQLLQNRPFYKCTECGFTAKSLHWQCPSCKRWAAIKPIQGIDGE